MEEIKYSYKSLNKTLFHALINRPEQVVETNWTLNENQKHGW